MGFFRLLGFGLGVGGCRVFVRFILVRKYFRVFRFGLDKYYGFRILFCYLFC